MKDSEGKTAVVTGGASGIGLAIVHALAKRGCRVALIDVEAQALDAAVSQLRQEGSNADERGFVSDVALRQSLDDTAKKGAGRLRQGAFGVR